MLRIVDLQWNSFEGQEKKLINKLCRWAEIIKEIAIVSSNKPQNIIFGALLIKRTPFDESGA